MESKKAESVKKKNKCTALAILLLLVLLGVSTLAPTVSYAGKNSDKSSEKAQDKGTDNDDEIAEATSSIREVHNIKVNNKKYCFFSENNVILTPEEIAVMTDEILVATVIVRSGLYMRKSNCTKESNSNISPAEWVKKGGTFWLDKEDIKSIRDAHPQAGKPVKLYMDLEISTEHESKEAVEKRKKEAEEAAKEAEEKKTETDPNATDPNASDSTAGGTADGSGDSATDSSQDTSQDSSQDSADSNNDPALIDEDYSTPRLKFFSTYKKTGEPLFFVVVATAADAKELPGYCVPGKQSYKEPKNEGGSSEPEEILPEYRTINMTDRSGAPVPAVLLEGEPVTLTWEEPNTGILDVDEKSSLIDSIPGGYASLAAALAILLAGIIAILKRRNSEE